MNSIIDKMAAINPSAPDAKEQLERLRAEYNTVRSNMLAQIQPLISSEIEAFNTLSEADKEKFNNSSEATQERKYSDQVNQTAARESSVATDVRLAILKANPPPPPPPPPAPAADANPTSNAAPTTSTGTDTKAPLTGAASDDSGAKQANPAGSTGAPPAAITAAEADLANNASLNTVDTTALNSGGTGSTEPVLRTELSKTQPPGKRLKNPLAYLSSYTYQISLYMISPKAYDAFVQSGRKDINALRNVTGEKGSGAWLIAQSGGINNEQEDRAPGFAFDYSIDNLSFNTITGGKAGMGDTNTTEIKFTITEPYGFSFVSNLRKAQKALESYAGKDIYMPKNPTKQFYILGIRFYGYDESGRIVKGNEVYDGATLDPTAPGNGAIFQRFYDIVLTEMKFKIDGKAVVYNISAASLAPSEAFGLKRGQINDTVVVEASDVQSAVDQLITKLNDRQKELVKNGKHPDLYNTYKVKYLGEASTVIAKAKLVSPADLDKFKWPGSGAKKQAEANDQTATKNNTPNDTKRQITFSASPEPTPIPKAINLIITQSQFLEQGLKTIYTTALEPPQGKTKMNQVDQGTKKILKWFNISSELSNARWNPETKDWVYDITYLIQVYETPVLDSAYANVTTKYYGPHKRYEYWYTGKNSEIISYISELNNAYFTVVVAPQDGAATSSTENPSTDGTSTGETGNAQKGSPAETPATPGIAQQQTTQGRIGAAATAAQDSFLTSLYDPASQAEAKIQIMGDPDFIMPDSSFSEDQLYNKFYGSDGFTVNPNGGQVFIEIDFKEAVDYSSTGYSVASPTGGAGISGAAGTLSINESILFWEYPEDIAKLVKGICYTVLTVTSQFSGGAFKQTLDCKINSFAQAEKPANGAGREPEANKTNQPAGKTPAAGTNTATGKSPSASNATNADSGLKGEPPAKASTTKEVATPSTALPDPNEIVVTASTRVVPTAAGGVADDDASGITVNTNIINSVTADAGREPNLFANLNVRTTLLPTSLTANTNTLLGRTI